MEVYMANSESTAEDFEPEEIQWTPSCNSCKWTGQRTTVGAAETQATTHDDEMHGGIKNTVLTSDSGQVQ